MTPAPQPKSLGSLVLRFFSSFGLATVVLALLLLHTFLGTLEQVDHGLFESQKKYFESFVVWDIDVGCCLRAMHIPSGNFVMPVLLPGGFTLMVLLAINLICGGIMRIVKRLNKARAEGVNHNILRFTGLVIAHGSMVFMLLAGLVSMYWKKDGAAMLSEGQTTEEFQSFHDTAIEIQQLSPAPAEGQAKVWVIDGSLFKDLKADAQSGKGRTFTQPDLPFEIMVMNYEVNCFPRKPESEETKRTVVDGYYLQPVAESPEQEKNIDGAYVKITHPDKRVETGILWRYANGPLTVTSGDKTWGISLGRKTYKLPFAIRLDDFQREVHPGTERARKFTSQITMLQDGQEHKKIITMNEPLRSQGYAVFQQSFDMSQRADGTMAERSQLEIVQNPSDHWPLISCVAVGIGLLIQMGSQLTRFLSRQSLPPATPNKAVS
ncbi:MAG: cytochrome c biogenesis protein ResB [Verrucomicrobiales bacterium]|nr:cytochrome c biogenesis protein ResB [Verrucomicrobiales bacterium]MCP5557648.1 cytochrome c biogenesis protein ResB [Verrucomicrobiaceae bacterium]